MLQQVKVITIRPRNRMWVHCGELNHVDVRITFLCVNDRTPPLTLPFPLPSAPIQMIFYKNGKRFQLRKQSLNTSVPLEKNAAKNSMRGTEFLLTNVTYRMYVQSQSGTFPSTRLRHVQIRVIILHHGMILLWPHITCLKALRSVARRWQKELVVKRALFVISMRHGIVTNGILPLKKTRTTNLSIKMARVPIQG